jgi:hypothetical protein
MCTLIAEQMVKSSRKDYQCQAAYWLHECGLNNLPKMNFSEYREIIKAKRQSWKVLKGQSYTKQFIVDGGQSWTFRAIPELHKICLKYEIYPEC